MKYKCIPCNHEFEAEGNTKPRCPRCLKIHDVEAIAASASPKSNKKSIIAPIVVLLIAGGVAAFYFATKKDQKAEDIGKVKDAKSLFDELNIPKEEAVEPCAPSPKIKEFAEKLASGKDGVDGMDALYQGILTLKAQNKWRPYPQREPREGRPLTADKFLQAIEEAKSEPVMALSYELTCLLYASAKSIDIDASMVEILSFKGDKSPADPEGKFGRFGVTAGVGDEAGKAALFDLFGGRSKDGAEAKLEVLSERAAMAPYFGIGALSLLVHQDMSPALALNDIAVKLDPKNPYFRSGRGFIFAATGVPTESLVEFEKALKFRSDAVQRVNLAEMLLLINPFDKRAETEVQSALTEMPDFARAHAVMGMVHLMRQEKDQAETELGLAERLDPKSPSIAMYWARFYASTMSSDEAVEKAKQAVTLSDRSVSSLLALAGIYREVTRFDDMRAVLDEVYTKIDTPSMQEQIKGIFGYDPSDKAVSKSGDTDKDTAADDAKPGSQYELQLGGGLGGPPKKGLSLDKDDSSPGGGLGAPGLGTGSLGGGLGKDLQLDMKMKQ
jgi:Tfp pilus assembly protein PilF